MRRPRRTVLDDRAEVVLEQHQRRGLARHVGAAPAHGDADVRGLERRRVVDAVAGHGDHLAGGAVGLHQPQLLLRAHAREHVHAPHRGGERARRPSPRSASPVSASPRLDARLARDVERGAGKVAGDHHHADAGAPALRHRLGHRGAQRIGERDEADPAERDSARGSSATRPRQSASATAEQAQALARGRGAPSSHRVQRVRRARAPSPARP